MTGGDFFKNSTTTYLVRVSVSAAVGDPHTLLSTVFMRAVSLLESIYNESCWLWGLWNIQRNRDCRCCSWRLPFRAVSTTNTTFIKMLPNISDTIKTKLLILLFRFIFFFPYCFQLHWQPITLSTFSLPIRFPLNLCEPIILLLSNLK